MYFVKIYEICISQIKCNRGYDVGPPDLGDLGLSGISSKGKSFKGTSLELGSGNSVALISFASLRVSTSGCKRCVDKGL